VQRGSPDQTKVLRLEIHTPPGASYSLSDCTLDGVPLTSGGQIARLITMVVFGAGKQIPGRQQTNEANCANFCCSHPNAPDFSVPFDNRPNRSKCQDILIAEFPPIPPTPSPTPSPIAAAVPLPGGLEAVLVHSAIGPLSTEFRAKIRKLGRTRLAL
jgi:hypothetical protein